MRASLRNGWFRRARGGGLGAVGEHDLDPARRAAPPGPRPLAFSLGSSEAITTLAMPAARIASEHGGWRPWWAQGSSVTDDRRARRVLAPRAGVLDRRDLGVDAAELGVEALADHLAPDARQHGADERVGADPPPALLGELERAAEQRPVGLCGGGLDARKGTLPA